MMTQVVLPRDVSAVRRLGRSLRQTVAAVGALVVLLANIMPLAEVSPALVCRLPIGLAHSIGPAAAA
jgi:hypothetical protein